MQFVEHLEMYFLASSYLRKSRGGLSFILFVLVRSELVLSYLPKNGKIQVFLSLRKSSAEENDSYLPKNGKIQVFLSWRKSSAEERKDDSLRKVESRMERWTNHKKNMM